MTPCVAVIHLGVKPHLFRQRSRHRGTERQFHRKPLVINNFLYHPQNSL